MGIRRTLCARVRAGPRNERWVGILGALLLVIASTAIAQPATDPVYRFFNTRTGTHFYTISAAERDNVIASYPQFALEGAAFAAFAQPAAGALPVWRFYNTRTGTHFYTLSIAERDQTIANYRDLAYEGAVYYAVTDPGTDGRVPLFRFFNTQTGAHFYTTSTAERDHVVASYPQFAAEGVAYYVYPVPTISSDGYRFLQQASFGPTPGETARANAMGVAAYLEDQFAQPKSGYPDGDFWFLSLDEASNCSFSAPRTSATYACARDQLTLFKLRNQFFANALTAPDQLRQRVAWALSQFFVISGMKDPDMEAGYVQARYHQILFDEAFGNFERLLTRVTLSPQMGHYLDMVDNRKANTRDGTEPNENFARELLQLFSIGLFELAPDGSPLKDANGQPRATYTQAEVKAFARVFTGWSYPPYDAAQAPGPDDERYFGKPMVTIARRHDPDPKTLLRGLALPAGQTAEADLAAALANVFAHPNVGPFFARHMIRQLVTGNPSPAYVARVSAAFDNDGTGVRGDMKSLLRAILLDPEARGSYKTDPNYGLLKEPVLYMMSLLRQLGAISDGNRLYEPARSMGQDVFYPPTVFSYYPAEYRIPGTSLVAPQFGIHNTNTVLHRANFAYDMIYGGGYSPDGELAGATGTKVDLKAYQAVAAVPEKLVGMVEANLFGGGMPPGIKGEIASAVAQLPASNTRERARTAVFLAVTSFQFQVIR